MKCSQHVYSTRLGPCTNDAVKYTLNYSVRNHEAWLLPACGTHLRKLVKASSYVGTLELFEGKPTMGTDVLTPQMMQRLGAPRRGAVVWLPGGEQVTVVDPLEITLKGCIWLVSVPKLADSADLGLRAGMIEVVRRPVPLDVQADRDRQRREHPTKVVVHPVEWQQVVRARNLPLDN